MNDKKRILLVEDDPNFGSILRYDNHSRFFAPDDVINNEFSKKSYFCTEFFPIIISDGCLIVYIRYVYNFD